MFDLEPREKRIIVILSALLVLGLGFSTYRKSRSQTEVTIGRFDLEKDSLRRRVNINTADPDELSGLKGVGRVLAERIVDYRLQKGLFISAEDIKNVKGVGQSLYDKIKDDITVE